MSRSDPELDSLLEPSLERPQAAHPIYSVKATFFVAFFGGPLAVTFFSALNSKRLDRLRRDLPVYVLGAVSVVIVAYVYSQQALDGSLFDLETDARQEFTRHYRYLSRGHAIVLCGLYYLLHRSAHRAQELIGEGPPSPWRAGIACALADAALSVGALLALTL